MEEYKVEYTSTVFFIRLPNKQKAWLKYEIEDGMMKLIQTYTPPEFRGRGLARLLVEKAIEVAKERNLKIYPICSYSVYYFLKYPEKREFLVEEFKKLSDAELGRYYNERLNEEKNKESS
jgi:predicted GNAT family acetyltransferase